VYRGFRKMNEGGLWKRDIALGGSSMKVTWREGSFTRDFESYAK